MARQYKLRLRDGTVLAVDQAGLRTWLVDPKAMVQPAGESGWRPLRAAIDELEGAPRAVAARPAARADKTIADHEIAAVPLAGAAAEPPVAFEAADGTPLAFAGAGGSASPDFTDALREIASASYAESRVHEKPRPVQDLPVIPFKALDDAPAPRPAIQDEAPRATALAAEADRLPELDLVEEDEARAFAADVKSAVSDVASLWAGRLKTLVRSATARPASPAPPPSASPSPAASSASVGAGPAPREVLAPPPRLADIPVLRFAPSEDAAGAGRRLSALAGWLRRHGAGAGVAAAAALVLASAPLWWPALAGLSFGGGKGRRAATSTAAALPAPPPTAPPEPELPPEVRAAVEQMPQLAPATVQLVLERRRPYRALPPEIFRHSESAAARGTESLSDPEQGELRSLRRAVLAALRPAERDRVRAYDRVRVGRGDLLVGEDERVMRLVARGVRALGSERRERLQALLGEAIEAALVEETRAADAASPGGRP